jgi:hypothetical protein
VQTKFNLLVLLQLHALFFDLRLVVLHLLLQVLARFNDKLMFSLILDELRLPLLQLLLLIKGLV